MNIKSLHDHLSLRMFLQTLQEQYAEGFANGNLEAMSEASGALSIAYSSLGNHALARKWADAFWEAWNLK
jgi:hypothetical protein